MGAARRWSVDPGRSTSRTSISEAATSIILAWRLVCAAVPAACPVRTCHRLRMSLAYRRSQVERQGRRSPCSRRSLRTRGDARVVPGSRHCARVARSRSRRARTRQRPSSARRAGTRRRPSDSTRRLLRSPGRSPRSARVCWRRSESLGTPSHPTARSCTPPPSGSGVTIFSASPSWNVPAARPPHRSDRRRREESAGAEARCGCIRVRRLPIVRRRTAAVR